MCYLFSIRVGHCPGEPGMSKHGKGARAGHARSDAVVPAGNRIASEADLALIKALRQGDEQAFARLVDQHHAALRRIARLYVSNPAAADEVVQDTWVGVIQGVWAFEGRSSLKTWILRILVNRAETRGVQEKRTLPLAALGLGDLPEAEVADSDVQQRAARRSQSLQPSTGPILRHAVARDPDPSPEAELLTKEAGEHMQRAIAALPANLRVVLTMRDVEGFSSEEVCNVLRIRETHQRVLLHRARSRVRAALQAYLEGGAR